MSDDQKLYSTKQAAQFLGVDRKTIQRYRKAGILIPNQFGANNAVLYSEEQLVRACRSLLAKIGSSGDISGDISGDMHLKFHPQVATCYKQVVTRYTEEQLKLVSLAGKIGITDSENVTCGDTCNEKGDTEEKTRNRLPVPQTLVTRLLNGGTTTEVTTPTEKTTSSVEVEEFYFDDNDDDIIIINDSFKANLPAEYRQNLTKLFNKLPVAPFGEIFSTPFNNEKTLITYAKLDYVNSGVTFDRKFDETHELILNSLYSFYRAENILFTSRNILQHIFGNVADHFQSELVEIIEQHLDELKYMRISMDLKDKFGNDAHIKIHGEKYRPVELEESLLDVSILKMKSAKNSKIVKVYRINRLSPIFKYAEKLKQITSWQTEYMKVPVRKTMQNALLCNYLLTKISLVKNSKNKYKNNGILFTTIHEDLNLDVDNRNKIKNIRDNIRKMFDYWIKIGLIKSYRFEKRGTSFYKISFNVA